MCRISIRMQLVWHLGLTGLLRNSRPPWLRQISRPQSRLPTHGWQGAADLLGARLCGDVLGRLWKVVMEVKRTSLVGTRHALLDLLTLNGFILIPLKWWIWTERVGNHCMLEELVCNRSDLSALAESGPSDPRRGGPWRRMSQWADHVIPLRLFQGQPSWLGSQCLLQSNVTCSYQWHCCKKSRVSSVISTDKRNPPLFAISSTARRSPPFFPFSRIVGQSDDYSQISGEKFIVIQSLLWHHWSETYIQRLSPL